MLQSIDRSSQRTCDNFQTVCHFCEISVTPCNNKLGKGLTDGQGDLDGVARFRDGDFPSHRICLSLSPASVRPFRKSNSSAH